jgi:hypothetical protein
MWRSLTPENRAPFVALLPDAQLFAPRSPDPNMTRGLPAEVVRLAKASAAMDFSREHAAPAQALNEIIWKSVKGFDQPMPEPRTSRLIPVGQSPEDD